VILLPNAQSRVAKVIKDTLSALQWEVLPSLTHSAYLFVCAPSDYHLFRSMQHGLADQQLKTYEEIKTMTR